MKKILYYTGFIGTATLNFWTFISSQSYYQLGVAVVFYLVLVYYAYRLFIHKKKVPVTAMLQAPAVANPNSTQSQNTTAKEKGEKQDLTVIDIDKRAFLKLIGATGISFFLLSLLNRKIGTPLLGGGTGFGVTAIENTSGQKIDPAQRQPTDSYLISEIDDGQITYYGFTNPQGEWFIMREDTENGTFRYAKGDPNFQINWENRETLNYDYYYNVFK
ncbi:MAG: hypothetical protein UT39_C0013G0012 [Candidatus Woesebacteria bacterium GW2011_GWA1_39_21]|uniref:Uncharacterized protein n=1 Tax=Candidatus Woesebacteria bacterium GW2011_GWA1_39_21 TaxID=1618550 RepID=A0A0G0N405_9BACT|nr:MAG: hypothetical protein UT39_C0013G0012 [Candidatus Woesebacteria bacterium GW2011_GWA1_39_21]